MFPDNANLASKDRSKKITHKVKSGETLAQLADEYGTTLDAIKKENKLKKMKLKEGQVLKITSQIRSEKADNAKLASNIKNKRKITHRVRSGENITTIASNYGVTPEQIKAWNPTQVNGTLIQAYTNLNIYPEKAVKGDAPQTSKSKRTSKTYVIKSGDTLEKIAKKFDIDVADLKKRNKNIKETSLQIGKKITIQ